MLGSRWIRVVSLLVSLIDGLVERVVFLARWRCENVARHE
jgi:hypothetical protein